MRKPFIETLTELAQKVEFELKESCICCGNKLPERFNCARTGAYGFYGEYPDFAFNTCDYCYLDYDKRKNLCVNLLSKP